MALNYRALLIPTAALDSSGSAKPNAVFSVTPMAGGSPVPVYGAAQGGTALDPAQVKTDSLGNISGLYVAAPGPYVLTFASGGTVVTAAIVDPRDTASPGDVATAIAGAPGGAGAPANALQLRLRTNDNDPTASPLQPVPAVKNADGLWVFTGSDGSSPVWINFPDVGWQSGDAIDYDPDNGLTYTAGGVYAHYLYLMFAPGAGYEPAVKGPARATILDNQWLTVDAESPTMLNYFQTTWITVQDAGDTNSTPYIASYIGANPVDISGATFTVIKLTA